MAESTRLTSGFALPGGPAAGTGLADDSAAQHLAQAARRLRDASRTRGTRALLRVTFGVGVALTVLAWMFRTRFGGEQALTRVDDLAQLVAAASAAAGGTSAALRHRGRLRLSWIGIAVGCGAWAAGQTVWSYSELIQHTATPFPGYADLGYLLFPVGAVVGLWTAPSVDSRHARQRWVLDGTIVAVAVTAVSWSTTLGVVAGAGGDSRFAFAVSLAYPIGDILVITMAVTSLTRRSARRGLLAVVGLAMALMAVADSAFTYLNAVGTYRTGAPSDLGWIASFLLLGLAGLAAALRPSAAVATAPTQRGAPTSMLPYLPLLVAVVVLAVRQLTGHRIDGLELGLAGSAFGLILARQYFTLRENRTLLADLAAREEQLHRQAFRDPLTGLANRALLLDRLEHALAQHGRTHRPLALLFCDLDDFKIVNDTLGHAVGDELLCGLAERLTGLMRDADTVARLGGDEFAILLDDSRGALVVAQRLVQAMAEPFGIGGELLYVQLSVGVTELRADEARCTVEDLLARADIAMYGAKRAGKGRVGSFDPELTLPNVTDLQLRRPLLEAVAARAVDIVYQPIVQLADGAVHAFESLARWTHHGAAVPPSEFIPLATRAGLLPDLTDHMLDLACAQLVRWNRSAGHSRVLVGVNVGPQLMTDLDFPARVATVAAQHRIRCDQLVLEITEDALVEDPDRAADVARRLRSMGIRLSLDDFGTGYSSLQHLRRLPLDSVKIDWAFTRDIDSGPQAETFVGALLGLGQDLGLTVIAEGIERPEQLAVLRRLGYVLGQGYLLGRPAPAPDVELPALAPALPANA